MVPNLQSIVGVAAGVALSICLTSPSAALEGAEVRICFDYACAHEATAHFDAPTLEAASRFMTAASGAADERERVAMVMAQFYGLAGRQTPIWRDRGGNRFDNTDLPGAMDCLDHTANTTTFLRLLQQAGALRFHRVGEPLRRVRFLVAEHWSAQIIEAATGEQFAVDTWYFDPGTPALVVPIQAWRDGDLPLPAKVRAP